MTNFWTDYFFPFLTVLVLLILYFTVKNLLPSYFNEKGKNLATKEDISNLTELVEKVKYTFTKETEHLKSNLQFLKGIHGSLISEERNAVIDFNEKYFAWLNSLMDTGFSGIDQYDNSEIERFRQNLAQQYNLFLNSHSRFDLFIENGELVASSHAVKIETLKLLGTLPQEYLLQIKSINVESDFINHAPVLERSEKMKPLFSKRMELYKKYNDDIINNYKIIAPKAVALQKLCRDYMYELIEKENKQTNLM